MPQSACYTSVMHRRLVLPLLVAFALAAPAVAVPALVTPAAAAPGAAAAKHDKAPRKKQKTRRTQPRSYGFLPGVRTPEQIERQRRADARRGWIVYDGWGNVYRYGIPDAGFHRGRWSGGTMGPCWTQTPIGPVWNCGK